MTAILFLDFSELSSESIDLCTVASLGFKPSPRNGLTAGKSDFRSIPVYTGTDRMCALCTCGFTTRQATQNKNIAFGV